MLIGLTQPADPDYLNYYMPGSTSNYSHTDDPKLVEMFMDGAKQTDFNKRKEIYKDIQKYLKDNQFSTALYAQDFFVVQSKDLKGGLKDFWEGSTDDVHKWELN